MLTANLSSGQNHLMRPSERWAALKPLNRPTLMIDAAHKAV